MLPFVQNIKQYQLDRNRLPENLRYRMKLFEDSYELFLTVKDPAVLEFIKAGLRFMHDILINDLKDFIEESKYNKIGVKSGFIIIDLNAYKWDKTFSLN